MRVDVYFESANHADLVAQFASEDLYMACLPLLKEVAQNARMTVTESVKEDERLNDDELQIEVDNLRSELKYFYGGGV